MTQPDVTLYLPQRAPFVMIDKVVSADDKESVTSFVVRDGHLLVENGVFTEAGLIENMAQTAAAGTGFQAAQEHRPAPVGFIGALKGFQLVELPSVGDELTTKVSVVTRVMNATIVQGRVFKGERLLASCELKIFLQAETQT